MEKPKEIPMLKSWEEHLGVVETIHEEEYECSSESSSPSLSQSLSSPPTPLHSRVRSWTLATGEATDVSIYVMGTCFRLHKAPLVSKSGYLRRQLTELSEITLPLNITTDTFTLVTEFCYSTQVVLTPFNVAALRTAAELLDMAVGDNLKQITEAYFRRVVSTNSELALTVFRSCLKLLPEAETAASLLSRCVGSLDLAGGDQEVDDCIGQIVSLPPQGFLVVAEVFQSSFGNHDLLYTIVDLYIKEHSSQISEDQKSDICNLVDCDKLSPEFLIHAVQNPRLPLRFIVRAMLIEQLNTRRAIFTASTTAKTATTTTTGGTATLGSILRRDAAAREAALMKAEMDATSSRIQSLERELAGMKKLLQKSEKQIQELAADNNNKNAVMEMGQSRHRNSMEAIPEEVMGDRGEAGTGRRVVGSSSRSSSFHYGIREAEVTRGERGSVSFAGGRSSGIGREEIISPSSCIEIIPEDKNKSGNVGGKGLISRLKKKFWVSKSAGKVSGEGVSR